MSLSADDLAACSKFKQRNTLLNRSSRNAEEILPIRLGESAISLSKVGGNGYGGSVELVCEKAVTPWELLSGREYLIGEVDRLLVNNKILDRESHREGCSSIKRVERREETEE